MHIPQPSPLMALPASGPYYQTWVWCWFSTLLSAWKLQMQWGRTVLLQLWSTSGGTVRAAAEARQGLPGWWMLGAALGEMLWKKNDKKNPHQKNTDVNVMVCTVMPVLVPHWWHDTLGQLYSGTACFSMNKQRRLKGETALWRKCRFCVWLLVKTQEHSSWAQFSTNKILLPAVISPHNYSYKTRETCIHVYIIVLRIFYNITLST